MQNVKNKKKVQKYNTWFGIVLLAVHNTGMPQGVQRMLRVFAGGRYRGDHNRARSGERKTAL